MYHHSTRCAEARVVTAKQINTNGVLGKQTAGVTENIYAIIRMLDMGFERIPHWTTIRTVGGSNTPVIMGREFLTIYISKVTHHRNRSRNNQFMRHYFRNRCFDRDKH